MVPFSDEETPRKDCALSAIANLDRLDLDTGLWPLFVVACEMAGDEGRIQVLRVLAKMRTKGTGNARTITGIIESYWKRVDLSETEGTRLRWLGLLDCEAEVPWFV